MKMSKLRTSGIFRKTGFIFLLAAALACVAVLVSCDSKKTEEPVSDSEIVSETEKEIIPVDVSLSDTELEIGYGITRELSAEGGKNITWQSSDETIASVTADGKVRGVSLGECDLTAENEFGRTAQCHVTVKKTVYITIDDGPLNYCEKILNKLKKHDVKATFFVVNTYNIKLTKRMQEEGHLVGLHAYDHAFNVCYRSQYSYYADLEKLADVVEGYTGTRPNVIRFPGGASNRVAQRLYMRRMISGIEDLGYRAYDWTASSGDASATPIDAKTAASNALSGMGYNSNIILMHDKDCTPGALEIIIPILKYRGYVFETLDHYPENTYLLKSWYERSVGEDAIPCKALTVDHETYVINSDESFTLNAVMEPDDSTDYVRFVSDDSSIAKVDLEGKVTGIRHGETNVRAIASSGQEAVCKVNVM